MWYPKSARNHPQTSEKVVFTFYMLRTSSINAIKQKVQEHKLITARREVEVGDTDANGICSEDKL